MHKQCTIFRDKPKRTGCIYDIVCTSNVSVSRGFNYNRVAKRTLAIRHRTYTHETIYDC